MISFWNRILLLEEIACFKQIFLGRDSVTLLRATYELFRTAEGMR